jgi:hypothetical protein
MKSSLKDWLIFGSLMLGGFGFCCMHSYWTFIYSAIVMTQCIPTGAQ